MGNENNKSGSEASNNNVGVWAVIIIVLMVFGFILVFLSDADDSNQVDTTNNNETPATQPTRTSSDNQETATDLSYLYDVYMDACSAEANAEYCDCTWNYMLDVYGEEQFINEMMASEQTGAMSDEMVDAVEHCMYTLN